MRKIIFYLFTISLLANCSCRSAHSNKSDQSQTPKEMKATEITLPNSGLENMYKIDEGVYRSGQPSAKDFKALKEYGINSILNLRNWHSDKREAKGNELTLYRIKSRATKLTHEELLEAMTFLLESPKGVLIHCWHGSDRTGAVVATYRMVVQDWSKEEALDEMMHGGFGFYAKFADEIVPVLESLDIAVMRKKLGIEEVLTTDPVPIAKE